MKKIVITGANGFIISAFLENYASHFDEIIALVRRESEKLKLYKNVKQIIWNLNEEIPNELSDVDIFIHASYDSSRLQNNIKGLESMLKFVVKNEISKMIFLSSFSVYNPFSKGTLNENTSYSKVCDPYSLIKIKQEKHIKKVAKHCSKTDFVLLQPTIVYGLFGNWSLHGIKTVCAKKIEIPEGICNMVNVSDVAQAIFKASSQKLNNNYERFLISSKEQTSWEDFYKFHNRIIDEPNRLSILRNRSVNIYHPNFVINFIYKGVFSKLGSFFLIKIMPVVRKLKPIHSNSIEVKALMSEGKKLELFVPKGVNRIQHNVDFLVDISKANKFLDYNPKYTLNNSLRIQKDRYQNVK